jgi:hypothetical protein
MRHTTLAAAARRVEKRSCHGSSGGGIGGEEALGLRELRESRDSVASTSAFNERLSWEETDADHL